ncbi:EF-hand domain-containing protein [Sphingomonas sp. PB2P19]|uniref:EF-hand domain-containing protein n=1 Tax=Sphingomonas rhamnosi TaxID=3096156 RepID=UPI002FC9B37B
MWRYLAGGAATLAIVAAGWLLAGSNAKPDRVLPQQPRAEQAAGAAATPDPLPAAAPEATERTREQKRFGRYDKDRDGKVTRDEYLTARQKAYAKLDTDHDGRLSFDEWAVRATTKFAGADKDRSGAMTPVEFATTAVTRKPQARAKCPPVQTEDS